MKDHTPAEIMGQQVRLAAWDVFYAPLERGARRRLRVLLDKLDTMMDTQPMRAFRSNDPISATIHESARSAGDDDRGMADF